MKFLIMVTPTQPIVFLDDNSREKYHLKMIIGARMCVVRSQLLFGLKIGSPLLWRRMNNVERMSPLKMEQTARAVIETAICFRFLYE